MPTVRLYPPSPGGLRNGTDPSHRLVWSTPNEFSNPGYRESYPWADSAWTDSVCHRSSMRTGGTTPANPTAAPLSRPGFLIGCNAHSATASLRRVAGRMSLAGPIGTAHAVRESAPGQRKVFAVPIRFVMACAKGHLDEFPWHVWVAHRKDCKKKERADLYLRSKRPGLAGLILSCRECKAWRSMDSVFSARTWQGFRCRGKRPWLAAPDQTCDCEPRALQRGASNLYFPVLASALSIPPWSDSLQEALGVYWNPILSTQPEDRATFIRILAQGELAPVLNELGLGPEELAHQIEDRLARYNDDAILNIRQEEYRQFVLGTDTVSRDAREFEVRNVPLPDGLRPYFSRIVRAVRLREVRALRGFTRINPPGDENSPDIAAISVDNPGWLPAIEVRGEGIFLAFNQETLHRWEVQDVIEDRARRVHGAWRKEWKNRYGEGDPGWRVTPRYLLIHAFAHALMRQLTLECGYSTAALRERLYVSDGNDGNGWPLDLYGNFRR